MAYTGIFKTLPNDAWSAIGGVSGVESGFKYASSTVVSTSYVDVWPTANILSYLSAAETMDVVSTSPNDDLGGTGLERITLFGLDGSYNEVEETVTLDGTTPVTTTQTFLRVYRMRGIQSNNGSNDTFNAGVITASATTAGTDQAIIEVGTSNTLQGQFTVPANKYLVATTASITVRSGDQANVRFFVRNFGEVFTLRFEIDIVSNSDQFVFTPPIVVPPKADITVRAIKIAGGGDVGITASYNYYLVDSSLVNL